MAKKSKDEVPNPNSVANRDILQRLNFLYQASQLLGSMSSRDSLSDLQASGVGSDAARSRTTRKEFTKRRHPATLMDLSRSYVRSMKAIGQKTNVRMYVIRACRVGVFI